MNLTAKQAIFSANISPLKVEYSDSTAIGLIKQGSQKAFERLFKDHFKSSARLCLHFFKG
jgi:hypothetical protein